MTRFTKPLIIAGILIAILVFAFFIFSTSTTETHRGALLDTTFSEPTPAQVEIKKLDGEYSWDQIRTLMLAFPNVVYDYDFELYGRQFNLLDEKLDLNHITIEDQGELVRKVIACMPNLKYLDMDFCHVDNEHMAAIRDDFPNVKVVWRVWFGGSYTVRTDCTKILASNPGLAGNLKEYNTEGLQYCTDVKYIDIGHNQDIGDISFLGNMPNLEVCIIAMDDITDEMLEVLRNCPNLEFLEIQTNHITDLSPLSKMHNLKHLNIACNYNLVDISPLFGLTQLERLWIGGYVNIPQDQIDEMYSRAKEAGNTDLIIETKYLDPHAGWRWGNERYDLLKEQLGYDGLDYQVIWNDPNYLGENQEGYY